jgi:hypothetical protein
MEMIVYQTIRTHLPAALPARFFHVFKNNNRSSSPKKYSPAGLLDSSHGKAHPHIRFSSLSAFIHHPFHYQMCQYE